MRLCWQLSPSGLRRLWEHDAQPCSRQQRQECHPCLQMHGPFGRTRLAPTPRPFLTCSACTTQSCAPLCHSLTCVSSPATHVPQCLEDMRFFLPHESITGRVSQGPNQTSLQPPAAPGYPSPWGVLGPTWGGCWDVPLPCGRGSSCHSWLVPLGRRSPFPARRVAAMPASSPSPGHQNPLPQVWL